MEALIVINKFRLEFRLKGLPPMANQMLRSNWRVRIGHTNTWKKKVFFEVAKLKPHSPLKRAQLTLVRASSKEPDFDGLVSCFKPIIDALVEADILENDRTENIGQPTYRWEKCGTGNGHVVVRVEEI